MLDFFRQLFSPTDPLFVSVAMHPETFARLNRIARHTSQPGDSIIDLAVREWLAGHEAALLEGDETLREKC